MRFFLTDRSRKIPLTRNSYYAIGRTIRDFCNRWAETWEEVKLVKPLGQKREKPTFAMPPEMLDAVAHHVRSRILKFGSGAEELKSKENATQLAKDLGKYPSA